MSSIRGSGCDETEWGGVSLIVLRLNFIYKSLLTNKRLFLESEPAGTHLFSKSFTLTTTQRIYSLGATDWKIHPGCYSLWTNRNSHFILRQHT